MKHLFLYLVGFFLLIIILAFPQKIQASARTCTISLSKNEIGFGESSTINYSGTSPDGDVSVILVKWPNGETISSLSNLALYNNVNYYSLGNCRADGNNCQATIPPSLPVGQYKTFCQIMVAPDPCSGNPFCSYKGGFDNTCSANGFNSCSNQDGASLKVKGATLPGAPDKFQETEVFNLNSPSQIAGFFTQDHRTYQTGSLPSSVSFTGTGVTLNDKVGIGIVNPLKDEPFYKVEVTLTDANQQDLIGYLTLIDNWWSSQSPTNGLSAGIDTSQSKNTYWYWHTDFKMPGQGVSQEQFDWSKSALNKFIKRNQGDVKIEIYITPNGTYPVINGANFGSFPDLYIGSYTYRRPTSFNYIVLNKFNEGGDPVTFKNLKIVKLDNSVSSIDDINAYFIKKTIESDTFTNLVNNSASFNGTGGFQNALWVAFLYRGYDYYFKTDHKSRVQQLIDSYLNVLPSYVDQNLARYGTENTININHSFINSIQANPFIFYAIKDYLRTDQLNQFQTQFGRIIDTTETYIKSDGSFPLAIAYQCNNAADEAEWLLSLYAGYYANFPNDSPRTEKLLDYITFIGFLVLSDGKSINQAYGDTIKFKYLNDSYNNFVAQYIWPTGEADHHDFHPSLNYSIGFVGIPAVVRNVLEKVGVNIPTVSRNLDLVYQKSIKSNLNISTFRYNNPVPGWDHSETRCGTNNLPSPIVRQDSYAFYPDGTIRDFSGFTNPSLVEDWGSIYTSYHVLENYGDYDLSLPFAKNLYYSLFSGAGKLFCDHGDPGCGAGTNNFYNFFFSDSLFAMAFSKHSNFIQTGSGHVVDISNLRSLLQTFTSIFDYNNLVGNFGK